ncbi:hypothetical protein GCM10023186_15640 [Hymenobacter koreensis]|uniref:Uncharacterized protein n=1 Tax=Hymenobacter koreensis TaxID=1084523 RepID=A0ABP8IXK4_9BACT
MLLASGTIAAWAQEQPAPTISPIHPAYFNTFNCYPESPNGKSSVSTPPPILTIGPAPSGPRTYYGNCQTPRGVLKVLVV